MMWQPKEVNPLGLEEHEALTPFCQVHLRPKAVVRQDGVLFLGEPNERESRIEICG